MHFAPVRRSEYTSFSAGVESLAREVLGPDVVFDPWGIINARPGAAERTWHKDGAELYPGHPLDHILPCMALILVIPLVEGNDTNGPTAFALRTPRSPMAPDRADFIPHLPVESAVLWDYRISHQGLANSNEKSRPTIYATLLPSVMDRYEEFS